MLAEMIAQAEAFLHAEWRELRNGAGEMDMVHFGGMIRALHHVGLLTDDQRELWGRRSHTCPGHDDEGGRDWCAYCGSIPPCGQTALATPPGDPRGEEAPLGGRPVGSE